MSNIRIITDSVSDISYEDEKKYDIKILPYQVVIGDKSYTSRIDFDNEGFYKLMDEFDEIPKTSQITPYSFQELYLEEAKAGTTDILMVLINSTGSATHGNAVMAKEMFFDEYPEYKDSLNIYIFDGIGYSSLYGYPVVKAAIMKEEGKSVADIVDYLSEEIKQRRIYFGMYTLKYAGKSGRIPSAAAFLGDKLNLKPIMKISDNNIITGAKVRGDSKMIAKIAALTTSEIEPGTPYQIIYGSDVKCIEDMKKAMTEKLGYEPDAVYQIGAAVAANSGPKIVGVSFKVKK